MMSVRSVFYWLTAWLAVLVVIIPEQFADVDLWGRLSMGALFFQNGGRFPYFDVFSYTAPHARWVDHEWLTGLVFYQLLAKTGDTGFMLFKYGLVLAICGLLFVLHRWVYRMSALWAFYGLLILAPVYSVGLYATIRSHIFSFFFFLLFLVILEAVRAGRLRREWLWCLPVLGVIWGNLHGGFIVGVLLLASYGLIESLSQRALKAGAFHWLLAALLVLGVGFVNPYGPGYLAFLWHAWTLDRSFITEWKPVDPASWRFWPLQLLTIVGTILLLLRWRARPAEAQRGDLLAATVVLAWVMAMALKSARFQPFVAWTLIAFAPLLLMPPKADSPTGIQGLARFFDAQSSVFQRKIPILLLAGAVFGLLWLGLLGDWRLFARPKPWLDKAVLLADTLRTNLLRQPLGDEMTRGEPNARYPLGAFSYLRHSPYHGNLMVRFGLGEFAAWMLYPRFKVSMDGRYEEVYSQAQFMEIHRFYNADLPLADQAVHYVSEENAADFILTAPGVPHLSMLLTDERWARIYEDDFFIVLARKASLAKFPAYAPRQLFLTTKTVTIGDLVTPQELARFRN